MAQDLTQPLIEMSMRNIPVGKRRPAVKANDLTATHEGDSPENVGSSAFQKPMGLHCLLQE
jgi:hypothetical protein